MLTLKTEKLRKNTINDVLEIVNCFKRDWIRWADLSRLCRVLLSEYSTDGVGEPSQLKALMQQLVKDGLVKHKKVGSASYYKAA